MEIEAKRYHYQSCSPEHGKLCRFLGGSIGISGMNVMESLPISDLEPEREPKIRQGSDSSLKFGSMGSSSKTTVW